MFYNKRPRGFLQASGVFNSPVIVIPSAPSQRELPTRHASTTASRQRYAHKRPSYDDNDVTYDFALPETARVFRSAKLRARGIRSTSVPPIPTYVSTVTPEARSYIYASHLPSPRGRRVERERNYVISTDSPLFTQVSEVSRPMRALRREAPHYVARAYQLQVQRAVWTTCIL